MRSLVLLMSLSVGLAIAGSVRAEQSAPGVDAAKESPTYTCPMHPKVQSAKAGHCPVCKMKLQARNVAAPRDGAAPTSVMPEHDAAIADHAAMDHSKMESAGMDAMGMGGDAASCPMGKCMMGMSKGGSSPDATAKVGKPIAPAGYQRPVGRRCGGGC